MDFCFLYPECGYFYYNNEQAKATVKISGENAMSLDAVIHDYENNFIDSLHKDGLSNGDIIDIPVNGKRLGYYSVTVTLTDKKDTITKKTGVGITTEFEALAPEITKFGFNTNKAKPERDFGAIKKMGFRMIRMSWTNSYMSARRYLKKYDMKVLAQDLGKAIVRTDENTITNWDKYAKPTLNSAYLAQKDSHDIVSMYEFGNEFHQEGNLSLHAEWCKDTMISRLEEDPNGWYGTTGLAGVDINKAQELYEQGVFDYVNYIAVHPYCFPNAPENPNCYWSTSRLEDLANWMNEHNIDMPVCATEVGFPAFYDQKVCEVYSPGDMLTLESQIDHLIRGWLKFIAYGVKNTQIYGAVWNDGFGLMEKDGPAPWPAAMAACELVRRVDTAEYLGHYVDENDSNLYRLIFKKQNGELFAIIWKVVYYSRSCEKEKNYAVDNSGFTEADGCVKEKFNYTLKFAKEDYKVFDIMGNAIQSVNKCITIGERPLYVDGISEEILPFLTDKTIFKTKEVARKEPSKIVLGIQDSKPRRGAYMTSAFSWGETRTYLLRVHNYETKDLTDTLVLTLPDGLTTETTELNIFVPAGEIAEYRVNIKCNTITPCGYFKVRLDLKSGKASNAIQNVEITYPVRVLPINNALVEGTKIKIEFANCGETEINYNISVANPQARVILENSNVKISPKEKTIVSATFKDGDYPLEPILKLSIEAQKETTDCELVIPLNYIDTNGRKDIVAGYNLQSTFADDNPCGSLLGCAKPEPILAYSNIWLDEEYLYANFDVKDTEIVCAKLGRRNNIDCDGVWIRLYKDLDDKSPYRHFVAIPVDQCGRTEGARIDEIAGDVLFAEKYSDYDIKDATVTSKINNDGYVLQIKIRRSSIHLDENCKELIADIRIINMNHNDWPKLYDTGKRVYKII